ncbi:MAG: hypothetical protein ACOX9C_07770 [Kiritimatiellia bacterium]|jgi:hypothetical protein
MKQTRKRHFILLSLALMALSVLFHGCETAESYAAEKDVEPSASPSSNDRRDNDRYNPDVGGGAAQPGAVNPQITWDTSIQNYSLTIDPPNPTISQNSNSVTLTVKNPKPGCTYRWEVKDANLGKTDPQSADGQQCIYTGTRFTGQQQEVRVTEFRNNIKTSNYGWARVTHQAAP